MTVQGQELRIIWVWTSTYMSLLFAFLQQCQSYRVPQWLPGSGWHWWYTAYASRAWELRQNHRRHSDKRARTR
jgi:hypothetical protein